MTRRTKIPRNLPVPISEAALEMQRRRRAMDGLLGYAQAITIPGAPSAEDADGWLFRPVESGLAAHHRVMLRAIEKCLNLPYGRLMLFFPPGAAKSTYAAVVAPTWKMGRDANTFVLMTSYAATPIIRHSKRARQICASVEYQSIWNCRLREGERAADEWELSNGSHLFAAGLLGGITSSRCDVGIIDDPVAGRQEADSSAIRQATRSAYEDDFLTRLKPKASVILIATRWHPEDLAGSILPEDYDGRSGFIECRDGQHWYVLNVPALCERTDDPIGRKIGEYLWPEWFSKRHWAIYEKRPRTWSALYQQRPVPEAGLRFNRADFIRYPLGRHPNALRKYMASDFAVTDEQRTKPDADPDFSEHGIFGVDLIGDIWITEWWYGKCETDISVPEGVAMARRNEPDNWFGEGGVIENSVGPAIRAEMRKQNAWTLRTILPSSGDKLAKCRAFIGRVNARTVHVPECDWGERLIDMLCAFPAGHDDAFDTCGLIGRGLDLIYEAQEPSPDKPKVIVPLSIEHLEYGEHQAKMEELEARRHWR